jgi:hypothetical protein
MSDFDTVLERLVTDPSFAGALAADPAAALAGYRLSTDEVELLRSQVSAGDGGDRTVETRTSKASLMGLLGPLTGLGGHGQTVVGRGFGAHPHEQFAPNVREGLAPVDNSAPNPYDENPYNQGSAAEAPNQSSAAEAPVPVGDQPATDYHARVDADGDGHWDKYVAVRHADGSVDVYEDRNGDGRIDFVGHDANGDGVLESADYDENFDGVMDTHLADTNGDGWMDTRQQTGR